YRARQYDEAIEECRTTVAMDPNYAPAHWYLGWAYLGRGMHEEAIAEVRRGVELAPGDPSGRFFLAYSLAVAGRTVEARELLG
ncbi:MAG: tetratricopeptide repeat protein, partial [Gemmatimonadetes bacterium]|nr:tetratricopeptide repeat protein [Gemmatimonadota bacterium]